MCLRLLYIYSPYTTHIIFHLHSPEKENRSFMQENNGCFELFIKHKNEALIKRKEIHLRRYAVYAVRAPQQRDTKIIKDVLRALYTYIRWLKTCRTHKQKFVQQNISFEFPKVSLPITLINLFIALRFIFICIFYVSLNGWVIVTHKISFFNNTLPFNPQYI